MLKNPSDARCPAFHLISVKTYKMLINRLAKQFEPSIKMG